MNKELSVENGVIYEFKDRDPVGEYDGAKYVRLDCLITEDYADLYRNYDNIEEFNRLRGVSPEDDTVKDKFDAMGLLFELEKEIFNKFIDNLDENITRFLSPYLGNNEYNINLGAVGAYMDVITATKFRKRLWDIEEGYIPPYRAFDKDNLKSIFLQSNNERPYFMLPIRYGYLTKENLGINIDEPNALTRKVEEIMQDKEKAVLLKNNRKILFVKSIKKNGVEFKVKTKDDKFELTELAVEMKRLEERYGIVICITQVQLQPLVNRILWEMNVIKGRVWRKGAKTVREGHANILEHYPVNLLVLFSGRPVGEVMTTNSEGVMVIDIHSVGLGYIEKYEQDLSAVYIKPILMQAKSITTGTSLRIPTEGLVTTLPDPNEDSQYPSSQKINYILLNINKLNSTYFVVPYYKVDILKYGLERIEIPEEVIEKLIVVKEDEMDE